MKNLDRRTFLKLIGAASAIASVGSAPFLAKINKAGKVMSISASAKLPPAPYPALATKVVDGSVDLTQGTGILVSRVLRGDPDPSIALPGSTRVIRLVGAQPSGSLLRLHGVIDESSQIRAGEHREVEILVDTQRGTLTVPFAGGLVTLALANHS